jgi:exonuclease SbcC
LRFRLHLVPRSTEIRLATAPTSRASCETQDRADVDPVHNLRLLPQGEFARFLSDKPSDRQDLLVRLLGLGLYDRIRQMASSRGAEARNRITLKEEELTSLADITKDTELEAKRNG